MPTIANIAAPDFAYDDTDPAGFRSGLVRLTNQLGPRSTGMSVYELPPGQALCPYHYECGEEEWLLVLEGRPTLRTPDGEQELGPWDVTCFPVGPEGAHGLRNESNETVRVLMFSEVRNPSATVYPDSDKVGIWTGAGRAADLLAHRSSNVDYWSGEAGNPPGLAPS